MISQRKIEHEIRLKDGEMNLLGGILEEQELKSISGTPILGQIPILGHLFSQEKKERVNNEIVFLLVPHIVRGQELSELNQRSFDVGTATGIGLRMNAKPLQKSENNPGQQSSPVATQPVQQNPAQGVQPVQPQTGQPQASVQPQALGGQPQQQNVPMSAQQVPQALGQASPPAAVQQNSATPANGPVSFQLTPGSFTPAQGSSFAVNVVVSGGQDVFAVPLQ